ncbi:MAPEG family protein [Acinetobacter populi]|uniref:MAPEG family protein n=1 Tax=Acinetobacter populi TaxID=1582270 RepID=A0A1Z9YWX7_9GAMM|nr:MAPEG family protein [Acinetobacter populi]MCH4247671.1 MAPEG family protein [Acinetobacter populi]OUY06706.1 hypothetical protein CAP51_12320 [Acinetobacter populi]
MHSLNIIIMIILAACLLPYIFTVIARMSAGYNPKLHDNPRTFLENATGLAARANAVQKNSFEGLPLFIAAMLMADYLVVPDYLVILLGIAYLFFRVIYGLCYLANLSRLRSVFWLLATLCPILLLILCIKLN